MTSKHGSAIMIAHRNDDYATMARLLPEFIAEASREQLVAFCQREDRNGDFDTYDDGETVERETLQGIVTDWLPEFVANAEIDAR